MTRTKIELYSYFDEQLKKGNSLGVHTFETMTAINKSVTLKVQKNCVGGRGLRVAQKVRKGETIAKGYGTIKKISESVKDNPAYKLHNTRSTVLLLWEPTTQYPANLANTAAKDSNMNNCRIKHQVNSRIWRLEATRTLSPGDEVLVPYGQGFTTNINQLAKKQKNTKLFPPKYKRECNFCKKLIQNYKMTNHQKMCRNINSKT